MFRLEVFLLSVSDAVFSGAGAAHGMSAFHKTMSKGIGFLNLFRAERAQHMKIAVSDVTHNGRRKAEAIKIRARRKNALGEP